MDGGIGRYWAVRCIDDVCDGDDFSNLKAAQQYCNAVMLHEASQERNGYANCTVSDMSTKQRVFHIQQTIRLGVRNENRSARTSSVMNDAR